MKPKKPNCSCIFLSTLFLLLLFSPTELLAKKKKITMKIGTVAPEGTPWAELVSKAKKVIKKEAKKNLKDTKIRIKTYLGGILGGEKSMMRRVKKGELELFGGAIAPLATDVPELGAIELPYLFRTEKEVDDILDNVILEDTKKLLYNKGYIFMFWAESGFRHIGNREREIKNASHIKGMKFRSSVNQIHIDTYKAWGASPVPISTTETLSGLQTGVVDGFDNSSPLLPPGTPQSNTLLRPFTFISPQFVWPLEKAMKTFQRLFKKLLPEIGLN